MGLTVNPDKSKRGPILESEKWLYNSVPLETIDNFNYLGVVFNYTGSLRTDTQITFSLHFTPLGISLSALLAQPGAFLVLETINLRHFSTHC